MNETKINGYFVNTTLDNIYSGVNQIIDKNEMTSEKLIEGEEIHLLSTKLELYIYSNKSEPGDFLMNGEYFGSLQDAVSLFKLLENNFKDTGLKFEFEIYLEDESGNQIGESITLKS
jgi:hypothetical protein